MELDINNLFVTDTQNKSQSLASIMSKNIVLICMLRHFGWIFCKDQAAQLSSIQNEINQIDIELIFIGSGSPEQARFFQEDYKIDAKVFSDQELTIYKALGAKNSLISNITPGVWIAGLRAFLNGFMQSKTQGTYTQQGGVALLTKNGEVAYLYLSKYAGDHIEPRILLQKIKKIRS